MTHCFSELDLVDLDATELVFEVLVVLKDVCVSHVLALGGLEEHTCLPQGQRLQGSTKLVALWMWGERSREIMVG